MSGVFGSIGSGLGTVVGGVGGGVVGGVATGAKGALVGGAVGGVGGALVGSPALATVVGAPIDVGTTAVGAAGGAAVGFLYTAPEGIVAGTQAGASAGSDVGEGALGWIDDTWLGRKVNTLVHGNQTAAKAKPATQTRTCQGCNPCLALAAGAGGKYKGGAHAFMSQPVGDGLDSHHTPAAAASPLPRDMGPAIQMDPADHWRTASNGRMPGSAAYIAAQRGMTGSGNFMGAVAMDAVDVHAKFGGKYDGALEQMMAYALCLKANNLVK